MNLKKRITEHNQGKVESSKHFYPYELLHVEEFKLLKEARVRELFYKSTNGRRQIKEIVENWKNKRDFGGPSLGDIMGGAMGGQ